MPTFSITMSKEGRVVSQRAKHLAQLAGPLIWDKVTETWQADIVAQSVSDAVAFMQDVVKRQT